MTAKPPLGKTCLAWARAIKIPPPPGRPVPGPWTSTLPDGGAGRPDIGAELGGIPFGGPAISQGAAIYLTASGTGDSSITLLSGPQFLVVPPTGYFPGWPSGGSGMSGDGWNAAISQGSAIGNTGNYFVGFPNSPGIAQSNTGVTRGAYYFEYIIQGYDIFSEKTGVGAGRLQPDLSAWFNAGQFSITDSNGGAQIDGGNITNSFQASMAANGSAYTDLPLFKVPQGQAVGVAIMITDDFTPSLFNAQQLQPVPLVCVPCQELLIGPNGFGGFGR